MSMPAVLAIVLLAAAQNAQPPPDAEALPVSLARIQRLLARSPAIVVREHQPIFRVQVFGRKTRPEDFLGEKFWLGPVPFGGMTHADFIPMVSPPGLQYRIGFDATPLIASLITGLRAAKHAHDERAARAEVAAAVADLRKARRAAGLADK